MELVTWQLLVQCDFQLNPSSPLEKTFPVGTGLTAIKWLVVETAEENNPGVKVYLVK